mgnify:CR=1 FL=1
MAINELSPKQIENAKPRDTDYKITDGGSLYLLVKKTGGKYWRMNYRFAGKQATLGRVRISTLRNENETFSQLNSITYIGVFLRLVTYSHLP